MNSLVQVSNNDKYGLVTTSRIVADGLGKRHTEVLRSIDNISENADLRSLIIPTTYKVKGQKREYKEYLLTKDGFTLYMFNIQGYNDFKMAYINEFNRMEKILKGEQLELEPYKLEKKTYKGKPVLIVRDLEYLTGQAKNNLNWIIKTQGLGFLLQGRSLDDFKFENNSFYNMKYSLNILFEDDVYSLIKRYDVDSDKLKDVDKYFETDSKEEFNQDVDLYIRLRDLKNLYRSLGLYEINNDLRKKITRIISEELLRLGVLDKPTDDFSLGSADVWNMESEIRNLRVSLSKGKDFTKKQLELAANHN